MPSHRPAGKAASSRSRQTRELEQRKRILIVCEGKCTEPNYFDSLIKFHKLNTVKVDDGSIVDIKIEPAAGVALSLVEYAESLQPSKKNDRFEEIWCVFDMDENPADSFDNAISKAEQIPYLRSAWSNQAFELWYILHFEYIDTSPARDHGRKRGGKVRDYYTDRLDELVIEHLGRKQYDKNDIRLFEDLGPVRLQTAIKRADQLAAKWQPNDPYHRRCPATTVHLLVRRLLSLAPENIDRPNTYIDE